MDVLASIVDKHISCHYDIIPTLHKSIKVRTCAYVTCTLPVSFKNVHNSYWDQRIL